MDYQNLVNAVHRRAEQSSFGLRDEPHQSLTIWPAGRVKPGFYEQFQGTRMEGGIIIPG